VKRYAGGGFGIHENTVEMLPLTVFNAATFSRLFGDESDFRFWSAVSHALIHAATPREASDSVPSACGNCKVLFERLMFTSAATGNN